MYSSVLQSWILFVAEGEIAADGFGPRCTKCLPCTFTLVYQVGRSRGRFWNQFTATCRQFWILCCSGWWWCGLYFWWMVIWFLSYRWCDFGIGQLTGTDYIGELCTWDTALWYMNTVLLVALIDNICGSHSDDWIFQRSGSWYGLFCEVFPVHTIKTYRGSRGIVPCILNVGIRWR
jgi:hypothetical protein